MVHGFILRTKSVLKALLLPLLAPMQVRRYEETGVVTVDSMSFEVTHGLSVLLSGGLDEGVKTGIEHTVEGSWLKDFFASWFLDVDVETERDLR